MGRSAKRHDLRIHSTNSSKILITPPVPSHRFHKLDVGCAMQKMGVKVGNSIVIAGMSRAAGGQPLFTGGGFVERHAVRYYDACRIIP